MFLWCHNFFLSNQSQFTISSDYIFWLHTNPTTKKESLKKRVSNSTLRLEYIAVKKNANSLFWTITKHLCSCFRDLFCFQHRKQLLYVRDWHGVWIDNFVYWTLINITTRNYNALTNSCALLLTTAHAKSSQFAMTSPVVALSWIPTMSSSLAHRLIGMEFLVFAVLLDLFGLCWRCWLIDVD
jgi:hypothetical protein